MLKTQQIYKNLLQKVEVNYTSIKLLYCGNIRKHSYKVFWSLVLVMR